MAARALVLLLEALGQRLRGRAEQGAWSIVSVVTPLRILGAILVAGGLVLSVAPTLVHDPGAAPDLFEAVERHARWGLPIGIGSVLILRTRLRPWSATLASVVLALSLGYLVARVIGIVLEGSGSSRQWMYCGIEVVIGLAAAVYLRRKREQNPDAGEGHG